MLGAAALTVLVTTSLLTALVAYSGVVTRAGVAAVVDDAPARQVSVEVSAPSDAEGALDAQVRAVAAEAFAGLGPTVNLSTVSSSFGLPPGLGAIETTDGRPPLTVLVAYDDLASHAELVSGEWATDPVDGEPLPVTVHDEAAGALGLTPGDEVRLTSRGEAEVVDVVVAGTYRPRDDGDPAFFDDVLETAGRDDGSFLALGPFAATRAGYESRVPGRSVVRWRVAPDPALLDVDGIDLAVDGAAQVEAVIEDDTVSITGQSARILVDSRLARLDDAIAGPVQVARSTVAVPVLLLSLLGAIALVLTVLLLSERRRSETATMLARGATRAQLGRWTAAEALVLVVPAAVLGPLAAAAVLHALGTVGPIAGTDLVLSAAPDAGRWLTAALVATSCGVVLVALTLATASGSWRSTHTRASRRTVISRAGVDVALLALAAVALLQLRQYGIAGTAGLAGTGTDPLVVAAPAVVVLAVAVIALRAMPPVTAALQRGLRGGGPVGASLALWHVGRRPGRYAGPALLLVMATAVGTLSLVYTATWTTAQYDVAAQQVGADVRVTASSPSLEALPASDRNEAYLAEAGVSAVMGVARADSSGGESNAVLAVDAEQAAEVVVARPDLLGGASFAELVEPLLTERPGLPTVPLPDDAATLELTATLDNVSIADPTLPPVMSALVADDSGAVTRVSLGVLQPTAEPHPLTAPLGALRGGSAGALSLLAIDLQVDSFLTQPVALDLTVADLATNGPSGAEPLSADGWVGAATGGSSLVQPPRVTVSESAPGGFRSGLRTGLEPRVGATTAVFRFAEQGVPLPAVSLEQVSGVSPPAVATRTLAERDDLAVGDEVVVRAPGGPLAVRITSVVDRLPTVEAGTAAVLVDLPTVATLALLRDTDPVRADEWWLSTSAGSSARVADAVAAVSGVPDEVLDLEELSQARLTSPLGIGLAGALGVGAAAALLVTAIGFAVHGAASARERLTEFAFLRAIGFSRRQLLGVLAAEQGVLASVGVLLGLAVGAVSSVLLVPYLVAPSLADIAPPLRLAADLWAVAFFAVVVLVVLALVAGGVARALRGQGLGSALRLGEDR